jgi:ankyrin repeat protein
MLAIVSEHANLECVKQLLASNATYTIREKVSGDNILHLAARSNTKLEILEYLVRSLNQEMLFERNLKGDTPLSISLI